MREDIIYYLWLQCVFGIRSKSFKKGIGFFNSAEEFYKASEYDYKICNCFEPSVIKKLTNKDMSKAEKILDDCKRLGYDIITYDDRLFSDKLRAISAPPVLLYLNGKMPELDNELSVAMVGSREATNQGLRAASEFAFSLSRANAVVVSGGAYGIDTASHKGVLQARGVTICVLGCGIDVGYPEVNIPMYEKIAENGAVVSEYPPGTPGGRANFPNRNRIICGLSDCILVVQAREKSGALITANDAASEGRKLFSIPGSIFFAENKGSNDLLRQGYSAAIEANDILNWYNSEKNSLNYSEKKDYNKKTEPVSALSAAADGEKRFEPEKKAPSGLSEKAEKIYKAIGDEPLTADCISEKSGVAAHEMFSALTELEMMGYVESLAGGKYMAKG